MPLWFWLVGFAALLLIIAMISYFFYATRPIPLWIWLLLFFAIIILIVALVLGLLLDKTPLQCAACESPTRERSLVTADQTPRGQPLPIPIDVQPREGMFNPAPIHHRPEPVPITAPVSAPIVVAPVVLPAPPPLVAPTKWKNHNHNHNHKHRHEPSSSSSSSSSSTINSSTDSSISYDFSIEKSTKIEKCKPSGKKYTPPTRLK